MLELVFAHKNFVCDQVNHPSMCASHFTYSIPQFSVIFLLEIISIWNVIIFPNICIFVQFLVVVVFIVFVLIVIYERGTKEKKRVQINCDHAWPNLSISYFIPLQFRIQSFTRAGYVLLSMFESTNALHKCIRYVQFNGTACVPYSFHIFFIFECAWHYSTALEKHFMDSMKNIFILDHKLTLQNRLSLLN